MKAGPIVIVLLALVWFPPAPEEKYLALQLPNNPSLQETIFLLNYTATTKYIYMKHNLWLVYGQERHIF